MSFLNVLKDIIGELGVRKTLEALQEAIENTRCAAIGICHLNKKTDLGAVERVLGSVAFVNFSRSALLVAKDHDDDAAVRLAHGKYNLSVKRIIHGQHERAERATGEVDVNVKLGLGVNCFTPEDRRAPIFLRCLEPHPYGEFRFGGFGHGSDFRFERHADPSGRRG